MREFHYSTFVARQQFLQRINRRNHQLILRFRRLVQLRLNRRILFIIQRALPRHQIGQPYPQRRQLIHLRHHRLYRRQLIAVFRQRLRIGDIILPEGKNMAQRIRAFAVFRIADQTRRPTIEVAHGRTFCR